MEKKDPLQYFYLLFLRLSCMSLKLSVFLRFNCYLINNWMFLFVCRERKWARIKIGNIQYYKRCNKFLGFRRKNGQQIQKFPVFSLLHSFQLQLQSNNNNNGKSALNGISFRQNGKCHAIPCRLLFVYEKKKITRIIDWASANLYCVHLKIDFGMEQ